MCLVLELAEGGDLKTYLREADSSVLQAKLGALYQISSAVEYLHSKSILHRDLAARNVLLRQANSLSAVMLADFGCKHTDYFSAGPHVLTVVFFPSGSLSEQQSRLLSTREYR